MMIYKVTCFVLSFLVLLRGKEKGIKKNIIACGTEGNTLGFIIILINIY